MVQPELQERRRKAPLSPVTYVVMGEGRERHRKKRGRKKKAEGMEEQKKEEEDEERFPLTDPLEVFGTDIMLEILSNLVSSSVALSLLVCRGWQAVASSDRIWAAKASPEYWRNLDPYWKSTGPPMRRYFHPDGSQSADPGDKVWGGHECCYSTVTSIVGEDRIRKHYVGINRWPRISVSRKHDWGWELSNHLYSYSSIPDAQKEGGTGPRYEFL